MTIRKLPLDDLSSDYASLEPVPAIGCNVYHVKKPFVLVQAAGYLKYVRAKSHNKAVFFRGQVNSIRLSHQDSIAVFGNLLRATNVMQK